MGISTGRDAPPDTAAKQMLAPFKNLRDVIF